jgi:hypothetical protein
MREKYSILYGLETVNSMVSLQKNSLLVVEIESLGGALASLSADAHGLP